MKVKYKDKLIAETSRSYNDLLYKPSINSVELIGNRTAGELNLYTQPQIDKLIAASRSVKTVTSLPDPTIPNTMYYVGPNADGVYDVYLYDSDNQQIYLGTSSMAEYTGTSPIKINGSNEVSLNFDSATLMNESGNLKVKSTDLARTNTADMIPNGKSVITYLDGYKGDLGVKIDHTNRKITSKFNDTILQDQTRETLKAGVTADGDELTYTKVIFTAAESPTGSTGSSFNVKVMRTTANYYVAIATNLGSGARYKSVYNNGTWTAWTSIDPVNMVGATTSKVGTAGYVPNPSISYSTAGMYRLSNAGSWTFPLPKFQIGSGTSTAANRLFKLAELDMTGTWTRGSCTLMLSTYNYQNMSFDPTIITVAACSGSTTGLTAQNFVRPVAANPHNLLYNYGNCELRIYYKVSGNTTTFALYLYCPYSYPSIYLTVLEDNTNMGSSKWKFANDTSSTTSVPSGYTLHATYSKANKNFGYQALTY